MAVDYQMYIDSSGDFEAVSESWQRSDGATIIMREGLADWSVAPTALFMREVLREKLGVEFDLVVWFKLDKLRLDAAVLRLAECVVHWAVPQGRDLALLKNGDEPLVIRAGGGRLVVRSQTMHPVWNQMLRGVPHDLADLPVI
jgi:hypothetical protein